MSLAIAEHCHAVHLAREVQFWRAAARAAWTPQSRRERIRRARDAAAQLRSLAQRIEERAARETGGVAHDPARSKNPGGASCAVCENPSHGST